MNTLASFVFSLEVFAVSLVTGAVCGLVGVAWLAKRHATIASKIDALAALVAKKLP
jgi:hypothetical protein